MYQFFNIKTKIFGNIEKIFNSASIITISLISVVVVLNQTANKTAFFEAGSIEVSPYAAAVYNLQGIKMLSISPLDDFVYRDDKKTHLGEKIKKSSNGSLLDILFQLIHNTFSAGKNILWRVEFTSTKSPVTINYYLTTHDQRIDIERKALFLNNFGSIGKSIIYCSDCFVGDDKNRLYFTDNPEEKLNFAKKFNKIPISIGKNQSFLNDANFVIVFMRGGEKAFSVPIDGEEVFLDEKWHLLEFKQNLGVEKDKSSVKQTILLSK